MGISRFSSQKNSINLNIFTDYEAQPHCYKDLFDRLVSKAELGQFVYLDFCPNNIAIDLKADRMYIIDLEDIRRPSKIDDLIKTIFYPYLADDYVQKIESIITL